MDACPLCRSRLGDAIRNRELLSRYPTILHVHACEQDGRAAECLAEETGIEILSVALPRTRSDNARQRFAGEIENLAARVAHRHGVSSDPARLPGAVERVERLRQRLRALRRTLPFADFAERFFEILAAGVDGTHDMPPAPPSGDALPLLLVGSCTSRNDLVFARDLADAGADIVDDLTPSIGGFLGTRIPPGTSSWEALASAWFDRPDVAARPNDAWHDWIRARIEATRPAGVLFRALRFCDVHSGEQVRVREAVAPLPFLFLDDEFDVSVRPRRRTRIEAFLEMIRCRKG
jgi:benzoyl-CoA reductase/2-hydroxyglutaryl-CoA dehydratase subunit BcrC/BadD/HgdB